MGKKNLVYWVLLLHIQPYRSLAEQSHLIAILNQHFYSTPLPNQEESSMNFKNIFDLFSIPHLNHL